LFGPPILAQERLLSERFPMGRGSIGVGSGRELKQSGDDDRTPSRGVSRAKGFGQNVQKSQGQKRYSGRSIRESFQGEQGGGARKVSSLQKLVKRSDQCWANWEYRISGREKGRKNGSRRKEEDLCVRCHYLRIRGPLLF